MNAPALALLALAAAAPPRPAQPAPPPEPDAAALAPLRALALAAAGDPGLEEVRAAAARVADAGAEDAGSFTRRARLAALLPRITAEVHREESSSRVVGLQAAGEVDYLRLAPGTAYVVRATWELSGLAAGTGEVAAAAAASVRARRRVEAQARATALLYERRARRLALLLEPPADPLARAQAELEVDRLGAELDALTGGLLSRGGR